VVRPGERKHRDRENQGTPPGNVKGADTKRIGDHKDRRYTPFESMGMVTTARIIQEIGIERIVHYRVSVC